MAHIFPTEMYAHMHHKYANVHKSSIHETPNWTLSKCPTVRKWINQMCYIDIIE